MIAGIKIFLSLNNVKKRSLIVDTPLGFGDSDLNGLGLKDILELWREIG
jgi:hypothetical protein